MRPIDVPLRQPTDACQYYVDPGSSKVYPIKIAKNGDKMDGMDIGSMPVWMELLFSDIINEYSIPTTRKRIRELSGDEAKVMLYYTLLEVKRQKRRLDAATSAENKAAIITAISSAVETHLELGDGDYTITTDTDEFTVRFDDAEFTTTQLTAFEAAFENAEIVVGEGYIIVEFEVV
jgi:hypothetical protein